jgi:TIR domain/SMODS-associated and fused to various effectors sensor domain
MNFVSTFLSHASVDKALVEAVAERLGHRGVLAWLDKNELRGMGSLLDALKEAVQQHATLTLFLSEASLRSNWCKDELRWALEAQEGYDHILPVYLGDPLSLVKGHELLRSRFLHPDGDRVNQLGYSCKQYPVDADPDAIAEIVATTIPDEIAEKIAVTAYRRSILDTWSEVVLILDQRGNGSRRGSPDVPENIASLKAPTLTFRPSLKDRQQRELLTDTAWEQVANALDTSLSLAPLNTIRGNTRKVRVLGNAQTSLMWVIGSHFDRTNNVNLYGYGKDDIVFTNKGQERDVPLPGCDAASYQLVGSNSISPGVPQVEVALGIGSRSYVQYAQKAAHNIPLFWIESGHISDSNQAMSLVADIVASIQNLRQNHGVQEIVLFWTTANQVALLAAANLTTHVIPRIKFMEWDHSDQRYLHLPMPNQR